MATHLKRELGFYDVVSITVGAIIGAGIFVITGVTSAVAGPALILSVLIAGSVACLIAISISQLVNAFPKEGGEYEYASQTLTPLASFLSGWLWNLDKTVGAGVLALGFATYLHIFVPFFSVQAIGLAAIFLVTFINYLGIGRTAKTIDVLVIIKLGVLLFFIIVGLPHLKTANFYPFAPFGISGIFNAAAIMFFAYVGFARPVYFVEEVKNPQRNVARGIFWGLGVSTVIYMLVTVVAVGLVGSGALGRTDTPLAVAVSKTGIGWAPSVVIFGAVVATFSVLLDDNLGLSRMIFAMGRKGDYPKFLGNINKKTGAPGKAIITTGIISALMVIFFDLRSLVQVGTFFILVYFALVNLSAIRLKKAQRKYPVVISWLGLAGTLILGFSLSLNSILIGLVAIFVGSVYFYLKGDVRGMKESSKRR